MVRALLTQWAKVCPREWIGRHVWCYGAQSYRPFLTASEYTVVPLKQVVQLPNGVPLEQADEVGRTLKTLFLPAL
jgi:hypothetical protein